MPAASMILSVPGAAATPAMPFADADSALPAAAVFGALIEATAATTATTAETSIISPPPVAQTLPQPPHMASAPSVLAPIAPDAPDAVEEVMAVSPAETGEAGAVPIDLLPAERPMVEPPTLVLPSTDRPTIAEMPEENVEAATSIPQLEPEAAALPEVPAQLQKPIEKPKAPKEDRISKPEAPKTDAAAQPIVPLPMQAAAVPVEQLASISDGILPGESESAEPELRLAARATPAKAPTAPPTAPQTGSRTQTAMPRSSEADAVQTTPQTADRAETSLSSPLLTQTLAPVTSRPPASPYPAMAQTPATVPVVQAQPGRIGADIGVEIARAAKGERDDLLIRLDPRDMGRINVRLSFDRDGTLRAVMSADSPAALDMLRRESGDLNRALADAGIRSDAQSLRFDTRSGDQGQGAGQGWQRGHSGGQQDQGGRPHPADDGAGDFIDPHYRPLRASGQVDLMA
ncbi:flagellar hook-length control protein FliK [Sphingobium sp.]|uniref:flagellar hook-length control protein FliK n=1 Tax=Sphingobium sp. TaxID=1912891 RepID=UPI0035C77524